MRRGGTAVDNAEVPGAVFDGWNVLSNKAIVYPELPAPWLSNNVLVLGDAAVTNNLPTTNSTSYTLSFRVTHATVAPGTRALTTTMKNTIWKIRSAPAAPTNTGYVASTMGTAPRRPTHPM